MVHLAARADGTEPSHEDAHESEPADVGAVSEPPRYRPPTTMKKHAARIFTAARSPAAAR